MCIRDRIPPVKRLPYLWAKKPMWIWNICAVSYTHLGEISRQRLSGQLYDRVRVPCRYRKTQLLDIGISCASSDLINENEFDACVICLLYTSNMLSRMAAVIARRISVSILILQTAIWAALRSISSGTPVSYTHLVRL